MYCACIVWYEELPPAVALDFLQQLEIAPEIAPEIGAVRPAASRAARLPPTLLPSGAV